MGFAWIIALIIALASPRSAAAGMRFLAEPENATDCQSALVGATTPFVQKKLKQLDKCHTTVFKCLQTVLPDDEAEDDPIDVCLERAASRCEKAVEKIVREEERLTATILDKCAALDPTELLRADGVGYEAITLDCADFGVTLGDTASVAECVVLQHECAVERMFLAQHPRAGELFSLVGADLGPDSCLEDFGGPGEGVDDIKLGRELLQCEQGVSQVSAKFMGTKLKAFGRCLDTLFDCVQMSPHDDTCLAKAAKTCDKAFASIEGGALRFEPTVTKSCGDVPFDQLLLDAGLFYEALLDEEWCPMVGAFGLATITHYNNCVYREHECIGDEILRFTAPRAEELLALVGRSLPGSFFCVSQEEEF
jgi:hypothetical protein